MPRLFAAISEGTIKARFVKQGLRLKAGTLPNWLPDAYGVAWYGEGGWGVRRERLDAEDEGLLAEVEGSALVSHVRPVSMGPLMNENIMPFIDQGWAFAHHGFIDRGTVVELLDPENKRILRGSTDSEAYFRLVLQEISRRHDPVMGLTAAVYKIEDVGYFTSLNSVLSDGKRLYILRYVKGNEKEYSLYIAEVDEGRVHATSRISLMVVEALFQGRGYVVSTSPAGEASELVPNKAIVVINEGMDEEIIPL